MSFQDWGKSTKPKRSPPTTGSMHYGSNAIPPPSSNNSVSPASTTGSNSSDNTRGMYSQASDSILQYQKNVGLLENMSRQVGTKSDGPVLQTQFNVQVGVINEIGSKIEKHLRTLEINMSYMSRTEASRCRATHVKLTRDFRTVETTFRKLVLDVRSKRENIEVQRLEREANERRRIEQDESDVEKMRLQMLEQEDLIAQEIMREREQEILKINKGMHQVNEIYKDLASIVGNQQSDIDNIEKTMEETKVNAEAGLSQVIKANKSQTESCIIL